MDFNILTAMNDILKEDGFMKSNEQSAKLDYKDIIQTQICFFRLPASDQCHLEVHIVSYAGDSHNITVLLQLPNDERIFCGSAFVQEKSTMREQIVQLFQVPVNKLSNALNPAVKCITNDLIRNNIFKHLGTRHVTRLELVCFWFRCALLTTSVDHDFWRPHFQREYENEDPQPAEPPGLTFRERYFARKRLLLEFTRPGTGFLAIRRGTPSLPAFFTDPPLPILPPRPMQPRHIPEPDNPLMPLQPGAHQPGRGRFRLPPFLGDFDNQNNLPPGARPQGDPLFRDPMQLQPDDTEPRPPVILRQAGGGTGRFNPFGQNPRGSGGASSSGFGFRGGGGFI